MKEGRRGGGGLDVMSIYEHAGYRALVSCKFSHLQEGGWGPLDLLLLNPSSDSQLRPTVHTMPSR